MKTKTLGMKTATLFTRKGLTSTILLVTIILSTAQAVKAQQETTTVPIKGYIDAEGSVDITPNLHDKAEGGMPLYSVTTSVTAENGIFNGSIEVPSELLSSHPQVFIEFARALPPFELIAEERMQYTSEASLGEEAPTPNGGSGSSSVAVCFTCGGSWPLQAGAIVTRSGGTNYE